jgi:Winged helix DNA-binding domain
MAARPVAAETVPLRVLNRTLLARQGLLERATRDPIDVITTLVGQQAQEPIDPYVGLWSRIEAFDPTVVSDAIEGRRLVRMGSFRTTLHLLTTEDALAIAPLTAGVHGRTFNNTAFSKALVGVDLDELLAAARTTLETEPMTPSDLGKRLGERWPDRDRTSLALYARYGLSLVQVPPRGLWQRTGRTTNTTLEAWTGRQPEATTLDELLVRYLRAFGPASTADMRTWSWFRDLRPVVDRLRPTLRAYRDESGRELLDLADAILADPDLPAPVRFLPQYDNVFLSHDDRSRINGSMTWNLDFAWKGPILIDGGINATWRTRRDRKTAVMTIELGRRLTKPERRDLDAGAEALSTFLDPDRPREIVVVEAG